MDLTIKIIHDAGPKLVNKWRKIVTLIFSALPELYFKLERSKLFVSQLSSNFELKSGGLEASEYIFFLCVGDLQFGKVRYTNPKTL